MRGTLRHSFFPSFRCGRSFLANRGLDHRVFRRRHFRPLLGRFHSGVAEFLAATFCNAGAVFGCLPSFHAPMHITPSTAGFGGRNDGVLFCSCSTVGAGRAGAFFRAFSMRVHRQFQFPERGALMNRRCRSTMMASVPLSSGVFWLRRFARCAVSLLPSAAGAGGSPHNRQPTVCDLRDGPAGAGSVRARLDQFTIRRGACIFTFRDVGQRCAGFSLPKPACGCEVEETSGARASDVRTVFFTLTNCTSCCGGARTALLACGDCQRENF